jgi:hypothetical protein
LTYLAGYTDILNCEQFGSKKQTSALDAAMSLLHDIQLAKSEKKITSVLFIDIKEAFDHVSINYLLRICQKLGLPKNLCFWIKSFMQDRYLQLAFDGELQEKTKVQIGIPQGSPVSPVLFLIYIRDIFSNIKDLEVKNPSYIDDISLITTSKSIERNCSILKAAAERLFQSQESNMIQFDMEKTELIHFHSRRNMNNRDYSISIQNEIIQPKNTIK